MVTDVAETVTRTKTTEVTPAVEGYCIMFEATVSQTNTITLTGVTTLLNAVLFTKSTGATITCTVATNVITVTGAATAVPIVGFAYGT